MATVSKQLFSVFGVLIKVASQYLVYYITSMQLHENIPIFVLSNGVSGVPEKNGDDVLLIPTFSKLVNVTARHEAAF